MYKVDVKNQSLKLWDGTTLRCCCDGNQSLSSWDSTTVRCYGGTQSLRSWDATTASAVTMFQAVLLPGMILNIHTG